MTLAQHIHKIRSRHQPMRTLLGNARSALTRERQRRPTLRTPGIVAPASRRRRGF